MTLKSSMILKLTFSARTFSHQRAVLTSGRILKKAFSVRTVLRVVYLGWLIWESVRPEVGNSERRKLARVVNTWLDADRLNLKSMRWFSIVNTWAWVELTVTNLVAMSST